MLRLLSREEISFSEIPERTTLNVASTDPQSFEIVKGTEYVPFYK